MLHSWSYYPSTLSCSLCLRIEKSKYTFGSVGVFHQQGPCTWSLPCLYEQVHFEYNMEEFYNSQIPPSEEPRSTSTNTLEIMDTQAITALRCWGRNYWSNPVVEVITNLLPVKRDNPGRPIIPISIGMVDFPETLCDFGSSINIMPRVLYENFFTHPLLETTVCLQPADQSLSFPKGILKNLCVWVGTLYAPAYFVVIETGTDERAPILGRPFLNTSRTVIYASAAKINFYIKGRKEMFSFKNKTTQVLEQSRHEPRKGTNRRNRNKQMWTESAKMVTAVQGGQDRRFKSPFLTKKDDPVTYQLLFGTMPLKPTYIQLQMILRLLTWEKTSTIHPSPLGDCCSAPLKQSSTLEPEKSTCTSPLRRYSAILLTLTI